MGIHSVAKQGQAILGCPNLDTGCTDPTATNYDPTAAIDDGSCIFGVDGCTDSNAFNFNSNATQDDGSCDYGWSCRELPGGGAVDEQMAYMPTGCLPGTSTNVGVFPTEAFCLSQNTSIPNGCGGTDMGAMVKPIEPIEPIDGEDKEKEKGKDRDKDKDKDREKKKDKDREKETERMQKLANISKK